MMKVKELKDILSKIDDNKDVVIEFDHSFGAFIVENLVVVRNGTKHLKSKVILSTKKK